MAIIRPYLHHVPQIAPDVFLAETAVVTGEVFIASQCSVWYHAVIRGDVGAIHIGERTNIQDGVIIHCTYQRTTTVIGKEVTIGHGAILHGCRIEDETLIGMGAIILDEAVVPRHTIVGAGTLVPERMVLESGFIYAGNPAQKLKEITPRYLEMMRAGMLRYLDKSLDYMKIDADGKG